MSPCNTPFVGQVEAIMNEHVRVVHVSDMMDTIGGVFSGTRHPPATCCMCGLSWRVPHEFGRSGD